MSIGLVGLKRGMTRIFTENGNSIPVTVIEAKPNRIVQVKTVEHDAYSAIQVTTGEKRRDKLTKPLQGHYGQIDPGLGLWEFRIAEDSPGFNVGDVISVELFQEGQQVDVRGTSKGKGFAGTIKRHNFASQRNSHGNSLSHRAPGSIGQNQSPGRVFKGKKMAGHLGNVRCTVQSLELVKIDKERNLLLVKGAVPGAANSVVIVKPAVKAQEKNRDKE